MDQKTPQQSTNPKGTSPGAPKHLVVLSQVAPTAGRIYRLHKDRIVIGSVISADIQLQGEGVAPIHAVLEISVGANGQPTAMIYDLASETGVFINGNKHITAQIKTGDELTIGRFRMRFAVEDPQSQKTSERVQQSAEGRKLFINENEDLKPLLLQDDRGIDEIFDYRPTSKTALEAVMSWSNTILDIEHFVDQSDVTIGSGEDNDFAIPPVVSSEVYSIATKTGEGYTIHLDASMKGVIQRQGQLLSVEQFRSLSGSGALSLGKNEFAKISVGDIDFYFSYTAAPPRLKARKILERDPFMLKVMLSSLTLTGTLVAAMLSVDVPQQIEVEELPDRLVTILYQPEKYPPRPKVEPVAKSVEQPEPPKPEKPQPEKTVKIEVTPNKTPPKEIPKTINVAQPKPQGGPSQKKQDEAKEGAGARAKGAEGARGSKNAAPGKTPQDAAKRPSPQGGTGRGGGNSEVQDQGNVDLLKGAASTITNILGNTAAKLGSGGSELKGFGNFSTLGKGGQALSGDGKGGGGNADTLAGGLANSGRGGGRVGTGLGAAGNGSGIIGGSSRVVLRTGGPEETVVMGSIDKAAIAAAIEAHRDEFRNCYEKEINADNPNIAGSLKSSFVIGSSGRVTQAGVESTTLNNANVEGCVLRVLKRIDFPRPVGGGVVQVSYPFKFANGK